MQTNFNAAAAVWSGQLDVVVSAGVEMMSRVPMGSNGGRPLEPRHRPLPDRPAGHLGRVARARSGSSRARSSTRTRSSRIAARSPRSTRGASSARSCRSSSRAARPTQRSTAGGTARVALHRFAVDEAPRRDTSRGGTRGAEAGVPPGRRRHGRELVADRRRRGGGADRERGGAARLGLEPRGRFVSFGLAGVDPTRMLHGNPRRARRRSRGRVCAGRRRRDRGQRGVRVGRAADRRTTPASPSGWN